MTYILLFAGAAFAGGVVSALLGWLATNPPEPFVGRKFAASVLRAFVAAVMGASTGAMVPPAGPVATVLMCLAAFAAGAGVDAGGKRVVNALKDLTPPPSGGATP